MSYETDNLELASLTRRSIAFVIDDLIVSILVLIIFWDNISSSGDDLATMLVVMNQFILPVLFLKFLYQGFFVYYYGATLGKMVVKIRVIDYNHFQRVSLSASLFRSFARILSEMFFYIGFVFAFFTEGRQTFHDKMGKTLVVNA